MKTKFLNAVCKTRYLALLVVLIFTCGNAWGAAEIVYTLDGTTTGGTSGYDVASDIEQDEISWKVTGNTTMNPWRLGGKGGSKSGSTSNLTRTIYNTDPIADDITSIVIKTGTKTLNALTNINVKVTTGSNGSGTVKQTFTETLQASHTYTFDKPAGQDWSGCYYLITFTFQAKGTSNQYIQFISADFYADASSCEKITTAPTVTATPGDRQISLSWPNQAEASSYTVTCTGGTPGAVTGTTTKSCTITGLTNGTSYTWTVTPVGDGTTYCESGNTAASASATPNVFRTITYYDKDGQHTTSLADGTNIATALTALYGDDDPVSCDATNYEYFVGWKVGEISGTASSVTLLDDEVVNASSPSNNYYAVWSDTDPSAGGWTKVTSISVGDVVVFAYDADYKEMTSVTTTGTTYGSAAAVDPYPDELSGDYALTVEAGNGGTGFSFKHGSVYLSWSSGNSLTTSGTKANASSWTISESSSGNFKFANVGTTSRILQYNSGSPRWACYTSSQAAFQIYKQSGGGDAEYITTCGATYTITLAGSPAGTVTGGTFSASASSASQGTVITLTANPTRGYEFGSWTVTDASSNPVSVSNNQFTMPASNVTVSATFNTATPLTITLNTNGKGTYEDPAEWPIYADETFTFPNVTPSDPTCATFVGWIAGTTFYGDGSTHDAPVTIAANTVSDPQNSDATYTAVFYETETTESDAYVKVTSAPANWANDHYLIVYEGDATHAAVAFDGKRDNGDNGKIDAASNGVEVTITSDAIAKTTRLAAAEWRIAAVTGGYSIQSASGFYIGQTTDANGLQTNSSNAYVNTLAYSSGFSVTSNNAVLRYNYASDQLRFRYYKSSSYTSQQAIQLYKLGTAVVETQTYTTNPACTPKYRVTVASVTGGSPNADPRYNPESTEVSLTANPSAGYAFTSWTITKTTGGDNVTTTLLPGAKATTANTTFSMPAYDVTVTAGYAKIVVSELKVMDGSTVVANTTGSVSGTVNISTGANKTLDVVITPADAFDHSWTASVTAGGTNASISNVTDAGFRVNGLAQGDATVTVTAPNDGNAKVVTFTVHVTDILPEEIILKRDGSDAPIDALTMYYDAANSRGQYVKVNVSFTPTPTNKDFSVSADGTFVTIHAQAHTNPNYYATLNGNKVTTSPVNVTFTSAATSSVTKNLVVTVLPCPADQFVDYIHGNATETRAAQVSADHWSINTSITTPTLSDAPESSSADCEVGHYHLIGWLPQSIAEALFEAGTPITSETEGLVTAGAEIEASGTTWYAIWAKKE